MSSLGSINIEKFLEKTKGAVRGRVVTDAKDRVYSADYKWTTTSDGFLLVARANDNGDQVKIKPIIELDESLIAFFGLYSGDGSKGSEKPNNPNVIVPSISFSQKEPNLVRFALDQFRRLFPGTIHFVFSLGEDSAFFMNGEGREMLKKHYGGKISPTPSLNNVRTKLNSADEQYLKERRPVQGSNEEHLAFYYFHKDAMQEILTSVKKNDLKMSGVVLRKDDNATASLRRPFKKGARVPGGSSRSDEMHVGGINGFGELFLKMLHEIEETIYSNSKSSSQSLIEWYDQPSKLGELVDVKDFFLKNEYGSLAGKRPEISEDGDSLIGRWPHSSEVQLSRKINIDPLFCYVAGLYLAEGSTPKSVIFSMFSKPVTGLSFGFTSSENVSIELVLRSLQKIFRSDDSLSSWKIKVGSQYFPELVVIGLKHGVAMLRGGESGDGKMRTMEISLSLKKWALDVAPSLIPFADKYSHVEPTGAGLARIDFSASSSLCRWFFPLLVYAVFSNQIKQPARQFINA